jgi:hypothetical protein
MMEIRDSGLYRDVLGFDTFEEYCKEKWDMGRRNAYYLIDAASVVDNVKRVAQIDSPSTLRQTIPLARLEPEQQREAWAKAVETAPEGKEKIIDFLRTFVLYGNSGRRDLPGCSAWDVRAHSPGTDQRLFLCAGHRAESLPPRGMQPGPSPRRPSRRI